MQCSHCMCKKTAMHRMTSLATVPFRHSILALRAPLALTVRLGCCDAQHTGQATQKDAHQSDCDTAALAADSAMTGNAVEYFSAFQSCRTTHVSSGHYPTGQNRVQPIEHMVDEALHA